MERGRQRSCRRELSWPDFCRLALQEARSPASPRAVLSSHPIGENDRSPPDRLLCPSLLIETAVLTILCTQESLRLGLRRTTSRCGATFNSIHAGKTPKTRLPGCSGSGLYAALRSHRVSP